MTLQKSILQLIEFGQPQGYPLQSYSQISYLQSLSFQESTRLLISTKA
jgi:hypothetical protein